MRVDLSRFKVESLRVTEGPRSPLRPDVREFRVRLTTPFAPDSTPDKPGAVFQTLMVEDCVPTAMVRMMVRQACLDALEHELDEALFIDDKRVENPHPLEVGQNGIIAVDREARTVVLEGGEHKRFDELPAVLLAYEESVWHP